MLDAVAPLESCAIEVIKKIVVGVELVCYLVGNAVLKFVRQSQAVVYITAFHCFSKTMAGLSRQMSEPCSWLTA
jgi:hypothetical protein